MPEEIEKDEFPVEDLRGEPREDEKFILSVNGTEYRMVPAVLRDIPKIGKLLDGIVTGEQGSTDLSMLSEEKLDKVAQLILLSLSKKDREVVTLDDIKDSCDMGALPRAIQAALSLNDFFDQMASVKRNMVAKGLSDLT